MQPHTISYAPLQAQPRKPITLADIQDNIITIETEGKTLQEILVNTIETILSASEDADSGFTRLNNCIYFYNGYYWQRADEEDLGAFLLGCACETVTQDRLTHHHTFTKGLRKQLDTLLTVILHQPRQNTLINFFNGTYDFFNAEGRLRGFNSTDYLTYRLPVSYLPNATAPLFHRLLNTILPEEAHQHIIAEYIAYIFTGLRLEKALFTYGTDNFGKNALMEIVASLLGEPAISRFSLTGLAGKYQRAQLFDKLLNFGSEISHASEVKQFKILASGEPVTAKHSHTPTFLMQHYGRFWFNANELPAHPEVTEAFYRRLVAIPFNEDIPEPDRNEHIVQTIIEKELSGIFNWILKGLQRLSAQNGFTQNPTEAALFAGYQEQENNVSLFIEENGYEKCANEGILLSELYPRYREYCIGNHYSPLAKRYFNEQLKSLGVIVERRREGNTVLLAKTG